MISSGDQADALLSNIQRERGGQLKIFLGAAPGVGKTYAMLNAANERRRQGVDVVIGIVETHGRQETEALIAGLEVLPRQTLQYKDRVLTELDLDGLLQRKPALALVDELAHTNAPGSRNLRRFQDIEELLDAGIDVYSTLNIQHLESLNDVVFAVTQVRQRETVPDQVLDRARDIVLVDLPPRELIERLKAGKVYLPEQAQSALGAFFSPSNLTALRELAMQTIADRVELDLKGELKAQRRDAAVALRRRVLVAIDGSENSDYLVRITRRIAERRQAPWVVASVATGAPVDATTRGRLDAAFSLAHRLGAQTVTLRGSNVPDEILAYAANHGVSTIVIGRTRERPLARMFNRTITQQLLTRGAHFELTIIGSPQTRAKSRRALRGNASSLHRDLPAFGFALMVSVIAVLIAGVGHLFLSLHNLSLVFMTAVMVVAVRSRLAVSVFCAVLCFSAYNFFYTEPYFSLAIDSKEDLTTVVLFFIAALICSRLAARLHAQVLMLRAANAHADALNELSRSLNLAADRNQVFQVGARALATIFQGTACVLKAQPGGAMTVVASEPPQASISTLDLAAADWSATNGQPAGRFTDTLSDTPYWFVPFGRDARGAIGVKFNDPLLPREKASLATAMIQDISDAAERTELVAALEGARLEGETERLRAALLASISHDLRSPLASMIGSASSLIAYGEKMPKSDHDDLLKTILQEGERLDRYIQNLLDMTRLGHGAMKIERDWVGLDDILSSALSRLRRSHPEVPVQLELQKDLHLMHVHPALVEQALYNILENAAKFSPLGASIALHASEQNGTLVIDISDRGPGIPEDQRARIFDMFYSVSGGDRNLPGTGLGLTICQGLIGAHGGSVSALPGLDGVGTMIRVTLPIPTPDAAN